MSEFICPDCGSAISPNALSCRCGWRKGEVKNNRRVTDHTKYRDSEKSFDDDFDYDDFVRREFGAGKRPTWFWQKSPRERFWWMIAVIVLIAFTVTMALL